jgi:UDP-N-acetylmuramate dehydrogenase
MNDPLQKKVVLAPYTTIKIGGPALYMGIPDNVETLAAMLRLADTEGYPWMLLGAGSNTLVGDVGFPGLVVNTKGLDSLEIDGMRIRAGAGVTLAALSFAAAEMSLSGMEPLAGIPGSVGGAVVMNAGAFGRSLGELIEEVELLVDGERRVLKGEDILWRYRGSSLKGEVVVGVILKLASGSREAIRKEMALFLDRRRSSQPLGKLTLGSVFKNPPGDWAGRLIEEAGFKGTKVGGAVVSDLHANFIVNLGAAKARDVSKLVDEIKAGVMARFSIYLEEEIVYAGVFEKDEDRVTAGRSVF